MHYKTPMIAILALSLSACTAPLQTPFAASSSYGAPTTFTGSSQPAIQYGRADQNAFALEREFRETDRAIRNARKRGDISKREARRLRARNDSLRDIGRTRGADGLSASEKEGLASAMRALQSQAGAAGLPPPTNSPD